MNPYSLLFPRCRSCDPLAVLLPWVTLSVLAIVVAYSGPVGQVEPPQEVQEPAQPAKPSKEWVLTCNKLNQAMGDLMQSMKTNDRTAQKTLQEKMRFLINQVNKLSVEQKAATATPKDKKSTPTKGQGKKRLAKPSAKKPPPEMNPDKQKRRLVRPKRRGVSEGQRPTQVTEKPQVKDSVFESTVKMDK